MCMQVCKYMYVCMYASLCIYRNEEGKIQLNSRITLCKVYVIEGLRGHLSEMAWATVLFTKSG